MKVVEINHKKVIETKTSNEIMDIFKRASISNGDLIVARCIKNSSDFYEDDNMFDMHYIVVMDATQLRIVCLDTDRLFSKHNDEKSLKTLAKSLGCKAYSIRVYKKDNFDITIGGLHSEH